MKRAILILSFVFLISCGESWMPRKYQTPDVIFKNWQKYARVRKYDKMFEYEYFNFSNVRYCYDQLYAPEVWGKATRQEQNKFIELYKDTLKRLLDEKPDDKYEALLRLKKSYQIHITRYIINTVKDTGWLYIAGDYPGEEKIRIIKIKGRWYLINPFGYHSYTPVLKTLKSQKH